MLEADNRTEPEVMERWKCERDKAERESAKANVSYITTREIHKSFKQAMQGQDLHASRNGNPS